MRYVPQLCCAGREKAGHRQRGGGWWRKHGDPFTLEYETTSGLARRGRLRWFLVNVSRATRWRCWSQISIMFVLRGGIGSTDFIDFSRDIVSLLSGRNLAFRSS